MSRKVYTSDVYDEKWVAPYLTLVREDALRDVFDALRWIVHAEARGECCPAIFLPVMSLTNKLNSGYSRSALKP